MKAKLFFLTLLFSSAISSLQAVPMLGEGGEKAKENEAEKIKFHQDEEQHQRDATASSENSSVLRGEMPQGGDSDNETTATVPAPATASSKKGPQKLTPEQGVQRARGLVAMAFQKNDLTAEEWVKAGQRIRMLKEWSQNIITPPPQAPIDWLMGKKLPEPPTEEEVNQARIIQAQALALEVALPAWKKSAIAKQAVKELLEAPREEATDCWAFWRKAPAAPHTADQVFQKVIENETAWRQAADNFRKQIEQLPEGLKEDVVSLWTGTKTSAEVNNPLAQAWADELKHFEQAEKGVSVIKEMNDMGMSQEIALKTFATNIILSEAQENVEVAMAAYEADKDQEHFNSATQAIDKLEKVRGTIEKLIGTEGLSADYQEKWTAALKRLTYIAAVYRANLAASSFWAAYDKETKEILGAAVDKDDILIRDRDAQPMLTVDLLAKGNEAVALFNEAIAAKKALFPEGSQLKIAGLEMEVEEPLTPEEEAAIGRIAEFQEQIADILCVIPSDFSS
ncbi:MAG: hypothetical protein K2W97_05530 [Chthoniobacterales bacterium]|nr:hypothetical protein [Chthoniobacterales bacterium]